MLFRGYKSLLKLPRIFTQARFQQNRPKLTVSGDVIPVFSNAHLFNDKIALRDSTGLFTYANLFIGAKELAADITRKLDGKTNQRVLFLCPNDSSYIITLWAIWMSGQIAVPVSPLHPKNILLYYANDCHANLLVTTPQYVDLMQRVGKNSNTQLHVIDDRATSKTVVGKSDLEAPLSLSFYSNSNALILYTSGTTGNPKGVVLTHKNLVFQINTLLEAWKWTENDVILHTLPLHHVHGIVNALLCPLYVGAKTVMLPKFDANAVWSHLLGLGTEPTTPKISVYMAVPTIYSKLIHEYNKVFASDPKMSEHIKSALRSKVRLMVSGSAPLPVPVYEKWLQISGHRLLERYGMSETGMSLSNLYDSDREPGYVGLPLPGVSVKIISEEKTSEGDVKSVEVTNNLGQVELKTNLKSETELAGDLLVKSDGVFKEYYGRPDSTKTEFTSDGWFKTGDVCLYSVVKNKFKMLGRRSVDIIKSGGYKISAVAVETVLLGHPNVKDCVVIGLEDAEWGEKVVAIVVPNKAGLSFKEIKNWATTKLPKYSVPSEWREVDDIPTNAMGKVNKKVLATQLFAKNVTNDK